LSLPLHILLFLGFYFVSDVLQIRREFNILSRLESDA
jgi:hypothetical protein